MTDPVPLHDAIEAEPADDALWLVLADWLEEHGEPLSAEVRRLVTIGSGDRRLAWEGLRQDLFRALPRRKAQLVAWDSLDRVLPAIELRYVVDRSLREFLEISRRFESGERVQAARLAVEAFDRIVHEDHQSQPGHDDLLHVFVSNMLYLRRNPDYACLIFARLAARFRYGPGFRQPESYSTPRLNSLLEPECRWQVARTLRYRPVGTSPA